MSMPTFEYEDKLLKSGYVRICGLDEAGRGPLAGPVVAAAVIFSVELLRNPEAFKGINDSKKLSIKQKEKWYKFLTELKGVQWSVGFVSEKIIDKINILEATKVAMAEALRGMTQKSDFLLIDGNFTLDLPDVNQKAIPQGDAKVISISAASIIAKVTRDRIMSEMHKKYPQYGFNKHKGYGTAFHFEMIKKFGPCRIHRQTFEPIKSMISAKKY